MSVSIERRNAILANQAFTLPEAGAKLSCSVLVVGGSTAAYTATLGALQAGTDVCLAQPQPVFGGQFTTQALPNAEDNRLVKVGSRFKRLAQETFSMSVSQRWFRDRQRQLQTVAGQRLLKGDADSGNTLLTTPLVAARAMNEAIAPYLAEGKLILIPFAVPVAVLGREEKGQLRQVSGVAFENTRSHHNFTVYSKITIEATELGDILAIGKIASRVGQEARHETAETRLPEAAYLDCQQAFAVAAAYEQPATGDADPVAAPEGYGEAPWLQFQDFSRPDWRQSGEPTPRSTPGFFSQALQTFRDRYFKSNPAAPPPSPEKLAEKSLANGKTSLVKRPEGQSNLFYCAIDYTHGLLVGTSLKERRRHLRQARDRVRAYLHFLQAKGEETIKPRQDITWTPDGIALSPYVREARRGVALTTIKHDHIAKAFYLRQARSHCFADSIGIGYYPYIEFCGAAHVPQAQPSKSVRLTGKERQVLPFTIPLAALAPETTDGLILSSKSIGTTHITNAVYRMHSVEWAIGEAGGHLAAFALKEWVSIRDVAQDEKLLRKFQGHLARNGIPLFWFDDVAHTDADFEAIQVMAAAAIVAAKSAQTLHFHPNHGVSRAAIATALVKLLGFESVTPEQSTFTDVVPQHWAYASIETIVAKVPMSGISDGRFFPSRSITRQELGTLIGNFMPNALEAAFANTPQDSGLLKRRELSRVLYKVLQVKLEI